MKKILITGANGQLGRAVQKEYANDADFILTDMIDDPNLIKLDISDIDSVMKIMRTEKPDVIINCAAMTNVDGCETARDTAFKANAIGPRNLAIASREMSAKLVHVSTDYVFAGDGNRAYTEFDEPAPVSAYGRSKLAGERFVQEFGDRYFILRTAWLYGDGKNFIKTMLKLSETRDEVSVVCDQKGAPTSAVELARMIKFLEPSDNYGLYHATCEGETNWADFTEVIFSKMARSTKVNHITSEEYAKLNPAAANRPKNSVLDNYMLRLVTDEYRMADWKDAFMEFASTL